MPATSYGRYRKEGGREVMNCRNDNSSPCHCRFFVVVHLVSHKEWRGEWNCESFKFIGMKMVHYVCSNPFRYAISIFLLPRSYVSALSNIIYTRHNIVEKFFWLDVHILSCCRFLDVTQPYRYIFSLLLCVAWYIMQNQKNHKRSAVFPCIARSFSFIYFGK